MAKQMLRGEVTDYQNRDGYRTGDIVKVIQFDKGESIVDPKEIGVPEHPSYRLAVKGRSVSNVKGRLSAFQVFRDAFSAMGKEKPGRGVSSKGKVGENAFRSMQMRSLTDPIFHQKVGGKSLAVKSYDKPLAFNAKSGPERAELARRSEINQELGARYMPDPEYPHQIDAFFDGKKLGGDIPKLGKPSPALLAAGIPNLPIHITETVLRKSSRGKDAEHRLTRQQVQELPFTINDPILVYRHTPKGHNIITEQTVNGKNVLVGISVKEVTGSMQVSRIDTAFGKRIEGVLAAIDAGRATLWNEKKTAAWLSSNRVPITQRVLTKLRSSGIPTTESVSRQGGEARFMPAIGGQDALGMFSAVERSVNNLKQETGSSSQMLAMIRKAGVKQEELDALGLDEFLSGNRKVSKNEIIDHLVENQITVEETVLGEKAPYYETGITETKHGEYVEPGAVEGSYREVLLRLPRGDARLHSGVVRGDDLSLDGMLTDMSIEGMEALDYGRYGDVVEFLNFSDRDLAKIRDTASHHGVTLEVSDSRGNKEAYTGGHYGEHPNVLAHIRFNERTGPNGERVLFIEEIQSDWHQEGRKKGYAVTERGVDSAVDAVDTTGFTAKEDTQYGEPYWRVLDGSGEHYYFTPKDGSPTPADAIRNSVRHKIKTELSGGEGVPDAPFKTSWHELAMKRMISYAAKNGYDAIAWTKGDTQFQRYGSSEIAWVKDGDGWKVSASEQQGGEAGGVDIEGAARAQGLLKEGGFSVTEKNELRTIVENTLMDRERGQWSAENFTKQVDKLTDRVWERMQTEDAGTSLPRKEGMEGFYDQRMVNMKTWKKLGLKVEEGSFAHSQDAGAGYRIGPEGVMQPGEKQPRLPAHFVHLASDVKGKVLDGGVARFMPARFNNPHLPMKANDVVNPFAVKPIGSLTLGETRKLLELIKDFTEDIRSVKLNKEEAGVAAVTKQERHEAYIRKSALEGINDFIKYQAGSRKAGAVHILIDHFSGSRGRISAKELLTMGEVIRTGEIRNRAKNKTQYTLHKGGIRFRVITGKNKSGERLISFYSDRK
ncbi:MAG: hypothetical protein H8E27_06955 [Verrucomicrobia subdivision 3 bacterium]|nr:hypothetical protein [Limisphaerales bacterium]